VAEPPEKLNALTKDVFEALDDHVDAIARETKTVVWSSCEAQALISLRAMT